MMMVGGKIKNVENVVHIVNSPTKKMKIYVMREIEIKNILFSSKNMKK